jgi:acyl-CoA thioester hydrolase
MRLALDPPRDPAAYPFHHDITVRFAETDAMGVVHHGSYLLYLEEARVRLLEALGHPYTEVRAHGVDLVVLECHVRYARPLRFGHRVRCHLGVGAITRTTFQVAYLLVAEGEPRAQAVTVHGAIDAAARPVRLPDWTGQMPALLLPAGEGHGSG